MMAGRRENKMQSFRIKLVVPIALVAGSMLCFRAYPQRPAAPSASSGSIDFGRDIRPILSDKCFACHGPDAVNNKSKLRFDTEAHALADLGNGRRAIVPGKPNQSGLVKRISSENKATRMPPVNSGRKLTEQEIARLTEWIAQGAPWEQHWAFVAPARPAVPQVKARTWPRNAIDS